MSFINYQNSNSSNATFSSRGNIQEAHSAAGIFNRQMGADNTSNGNGYQSIDKIEENISTKILLKLVARGNAIITELNRLIELVPTPFKQTATSEFLHNFNQNSSGERKLTLDNLICDFSYFKNAEIFESKIENDGILKKADENFCDTFSDTLTRFYLTFESVQRYANELNNFISDLEEETFVGQNLDSLLLDNENRQLLCEAFFLLGYMLMTTDNNFEGGLRERLIVSYYRYSLYKSSPDSSIDETCNLMRSTGFRSPCQQSYRATGSNQYFKPEAYPESFFSRVKVNQSVVNLMIAKLQAVDIYSQTSTAFPHPDHRSTALSKQASMLYVVLYFCPNILNNQRSRMREITDKFFYDNWVISIYMGEVVNLIEAWQPYKAAKESLIQLLELDSTKILANQYNSRFHKVDESLKEYLRDGYLSEDLVLEHSNKILNHIREANVILRWMLLQSQMNSVWQSKLTRTVYSIVMNNLPKVQFLFQFLQNLSDLENKSSKTFNNMISHKFDKIRENKGKALELITELIDIFSDLKPMRWIKPGANTKLVEILAKIRSTLEVYDFCQSSNSRDFVISLTNELNEAQDSYSDGKNMQVVQLFNDTRDNLLRIFRFLNITDEVNTILKFVKDFSYGWRIIDEKFTSHMQQLIKDDPRKVYRIEATFLKLASAFDTSLARISQSNLREDSISVSQYYSTKLVSYIRDVLHVIPASILELLSTIVTIQTENVIDDMPSKVSLESLKDFALPEKRIQILELTYKASHYAESMLLMQNTNIGSIKINSKQLLEDGIRRELVRKMSKSIQEILEFSETGSNNQPACKLAQNLLAKLVKLNAVMNGYKCSLEYIQDYLFIYGLRLWQEELANVIKFNVEQAIEILLSDGFLSQAKFHSKPENETFHSQRITDYSANPLKSSFIVRMLNEMLKITDPRSTIYEEQMSAWYNQKNRNEKVMDMKVFELVASSLCVTGLNGLDQMCCTLLNLELETLDTFILTSITNTKSLQAQNLSEALNSLTRLRQQSLLNATAAPADSKNNLPESDNCLRTFSSVLLKIAPYSEKIINSLLRIGQLQAFRTCISCVLSTKSRYEARNLYNCLDTLNTSLLSTLKHGKQSIQQKEIDSNFNGDDNDDLNYEYEDSDTDWDEVESESEEIEDQTRGMNESEIECKNKQQNEIDYDNINDNLEDSQLIFELTNHLEWIGLSDPMNKIYTLAFQTSNCSQVYEFRDKMLAMEMIFLVLLDQCSKFQFSPLISGFLPKQPKSFYETSYTVDGQPLFYGLMTFINHYKPFLQAKTTTGNFATTTSTSTVEETKVETTNTSCSATPLIRLLEYMSLYVKCSLDQKNVVSSMKTSNLTLETSNIILSTIELIRLSGQPSIELLSSTFLPQFVFETFQFSICHLNKQAKTC